MSVIDVRVLSRYVIELTFGTSEVKVLDLEPLLWGPAFEQVMSDYRLFLKVRADPEAGTIVWPNGEDWARSKAATPAP